MTNQLLGDLLAVIHQDGGQYQHKHGTRRAAEDAAKVVGQLRTENERMLSDIERLEKKHDDMLADTGDILKHLAASIRLDLRESKPATMARIEKSIRGESD